MLKTVFLMLLAMACAPGFSQTDSLRIDTVYVFHPNFDIGVFSGVWIPSGKASVLGIHPILGLKIGAVKRKFEFGVVEEFRIVRSPNDYQVEYHSTMVTTHQFLGLVFSGYGNYTLLQNSRSEILALGGLGFDELVTMMKDSPKYSRDVGIDRFYKSVGIGWRFHLGKTTWRNQYLGVEGVYNFVDYSGGRGTPLNGNSISLRLVYGSLQSISFGH